MKDLFHLENPFILMLSRTCDMIIINILFLICCIPIITIGPAIAGMTRVMQDMVYDTEGKILHRFFQAFKENFKQTCILGLAGTFIYISLICDFLLITAYFRGTGALIMYVLLAILVFLVTCILGYSMALIVRYENTLKEHITNALIMTFTKFGKSLLMAVIVLFPFALFFLLPMLFVQTLVFWFIIGFSFSCYIINIYLRPVFLSLENANV